MMHTHGTSNESTYADPPDAPPPASIDLQTFRTLAEHAQDGIAIASLDGVVQYANQSFCQMTGFGAHTIGTRIIEFNFPEDYSRQVEQDMMPMLQAEGRWRGIHRMRRPNNTAWMCQASVFMLMDAEGAPAHIATIFRDITSQQIQEQRLRDSETRLAALLANLPIAIYTTDREGNFTFLGGQAIEQLGARKDAVLGRSVFDLYKHFPDIIEQVGRSLRGEPAAFESMIGTTLFATWTTPLCDATGAPVGVLGVALNISDRKEAESERAALHEQIIAVQQAALRELSTPLIPISDGVVVMPLIGSIDSARAQQIVESLLSGVAELRASTTIIDITGVPVVDTQVANALLRAAQAVKLLGAQAILTGIRPEVAQTLVGLGVDLSGILTQSTLQSGVAAALRASVVR